MIKIIQETNEHIVYLAYFGDIPVRFLKNKKTGEILISADDACNAIGINKSFDEYLGTDEGLDVISEMKAKHPDKQIFGENGMIRKVMI